VLARIAKGGGLDLPGSRGDRAHINRVSRDRAERAGASRKETTHETFNDRINFCFGPFNSFALAQGAGGGSGGGASGSGTGGASSSMGTGGAPGAMGTTGNVSNSAGTTGMRPSGAIGTGGPNGTPNGPTTLSGTGSSQYGGSTAGTTGKN
jgi:hypothetical protein